jgi:hypothetical protein
MTTASPVDTAKKTPKRRLSLLGVLLAVVLVWAIVCGVIALQVARRLGFLGGTGPAVTISRETTYLVEPLRDDGYVDYFAAINQRSRQGVTRDNNAAVPLWQALGPAEILGCYGDEDCDGFFQELGVPRPPEDGDYFISLWEYASQIEGDPPLDRRRETGADEPGGPRDGIPTWESILHEQFVQASERPWSKEEFPKLAAWLEANQRPLRLVVEASKKERFYCPLIPLEESPLLFDALLHGSQRCRGVCDVLRARAMRRLDEGDVDEAWHDLLACHRWARLVAQGPMYFEVLIANRIDEIACSGDAGLAHHGNLTSEKARRFLDDLGQLEPLPGWFDRIDIAERFTFLNGVTAVAREGLDVLRSSSDEQSQLESLLWEWGGSEAFDWDGILRLGNTFFDQLVEIGRIADRSERRRALSEQYEELEREIDECRDPASLGKSLLEGGPRKVLSEKIGQLWLSLLTGASLETEDRGVVMLRLAKLSLALAAYRSEHGSYPDELPQLVPDYLDEVPRDVYADERLHYKRSGEHYVVYSVGPNGQDEKGRDYDSKPPGDDVAIRTPRGE